MTGAARNGVAVVQLGGRMAYAVPRILMAAGRLERFYTDLHLGSRWPGKAVMGSLPGRFAGRVSGVPADLVSSHQLLGLIYAALLRLLPRSMDTRGIHLWAGDRLCDGVLRKGLGNAGTIYAFSSAAERLFESGPGHERWRVLEQPCAPVDAELALLAEERTRWPGWENSPDVRYVDAARRREAVEWRAADRIICPSDYIAVCLARQGVETSKCRVVPYGVDAPPAYRMPRKKPDSSFRVLFVGTVRLLKGIPYLVEAARLLRDTDIQFRFVGPMLCNKAVLERSLPANVTLVGPVPRVRVWEEYRDTDCMCLPTLSEGSATVVYEALACGLPCVVTPNAGSIVRDGVEGRIVPIRDPAALAAALRELAQDHGLWHRMAEEALHRSEYGSLGSYSDRLLDALGIPGSTR